MASRPTKLSPELNIKLATQLDRKSSDPLYRQLGDEIRYRVATGDIAIGTKLPTVKEAAKLWGVNVHTVARAYGDLDYDGIVEMRRGRGTMVTAKPVESSIAQTPGATAGVASFVDWISSHAMRNFGLDRETLAELLVVPPARSDAEARLHFVECSSSQAAHHAREISKKWDVATRGWSLEWEDEPPPGPFVVTYFHYNDIRRRWPHRMAEANFVSIHPAENLRRKLQSQQQTGKYALVCLYEKSETMARSIAADVTAAMPQDWLDVQSQVVENSAETIRIISNVLYLFPPRLWWELTPDQKAAANVMEVEYEIAEPDMARLAHHFGWSLRAG